jgi:hypothetical protein
MPAVTFDPAAFKARYPEFAAVTDPLLQTYFNEAGLYLSNADNSPVADLSRRAVLLNMLTAHVADLGGVLSADGKPRPVGRISQASEGSVSASFESDPPTPGSGAWFKQTQYGAAFWQATSSLRGFRYIPCPTVY